MSRRPLSSFLAGSKSSLSATCLLLAFLGSSSCSTQTEGGRNSMSSSGGTSATGNSGGTAPMGTGGSGGSNVMPSTGGSAMGGSPSVGGTGGANANSGGTPESGGSSNNTGGTPNNTGGNVNSSGGNTASGGSSAAVPGSSCEGLPATCGPMENEDCCSSPLVTGGMFYRGEINDNGNPAMLSDFRMDRFEVTVGRYRKFVEAYDAWRAAGHPAVGEGAHPKTPGTGWDAAWTAELDVLAKDAAMLRQSLACGTKPNERTWSDTPGQHDTRPVQCVNWYMSLAFCIWDGGSLPTEAQFNYAQAGGAERRYLPWSNPPSAQQYDPKYASYECSIENSLEACIFKVGAHPLGDGKYGQADLGGNMWEWTMDWEAEYPTPCQDCSTVLDFDLSELAKPEEERQTEGRILRGGGWGNGSSGMRAGYRVGQHPQDFRGTGAGFRCVRVP